MEIKEITYKDKIAIEEDPDYPEENQVTDGNMNEIKEVVNYNGKKLKEVSEIELQTLQEENKKLKSALINVETEEAKSLHVEDASEVPAQLSVAGNQEQKTREGYNLLNSSLFDLSEVSDLATFNQKDGTITFNGTANTDINIKSLRKQIIAGTGKENIVIKTLGGSLNGRLRLAAQDTDYGNIQFAQIGTSSYTNKLTENIEYNIFSITITSGTVMNNLKLGFMIVNDSDLNKEYEPYGAMPSPDYPSTVICLGSNKNLFDKDNVNLISLNATNQENGTFSAATNQKHIYIECKPLTTYTITKSILADTTLGIYETGEIPAVNVNYHQLYLKAASTGIATVKTGENAKYLDIRLNSRALTEEELQEILDTLKIEEGTKATSYSPYEQGSTEIIKINNVSNFDTLANGKSSGDYFGLQFEMLNKFSCKITGKPNSNELRFGNSYNSKEILIPFEKGKHYKVKNSFNKVSEITLVNLKENSFRLVYVTNKSEIQIQEGDDGISSVRLYPDVNTTYDNAIIDCVIYTQEDDDFIPGQTDYILNIQQEMLSGDYFVKEADGWKEVHNYSKEIFDGTEQFTVSSLKNTRMVLSIANAKQNPEEVLAVSNSFLGVTYNQVQENKLINAICVNNGYLSIDTDGITNVSEFKQTLADKYNAGNPVYIYYKEATPTKLPCTEEQSAVLEELSNLDLFDGVNNIITAENIAKLKLKYVADTKTYIDNQINERLSNIENQIVNLSGGN